jgi:hypothetical protein
MPASKIDMKKIAEVADMCVSDMATDYTGLLHIAGRIRRAFGRISNEDSKQLSLEVVRLIVKRGLRPGDYLNTGLKYWDEKPEQAIARIDREWIPTNGDPTLVNPICWFGRSKR